MNDTGRTKVLKKKADRKRSAYLPIFCRGYLLGEAAGFAVLSVFEFTSDTFLSSIAGLTFVLSAGFLSSTFLSSATGEPVGDATGEAVGLAAGVGEEAVFGVFLTSGVDEHAPIANAIEATNVANINDLLIVFSLKSPSIFDRRAS